MAFKTKKKTKKQLTGLKLTVAWEARAQGLQRIERRELDETFFVAVYSSVV